MLQRSDSTNLGPAQTSDWDKRRTSTNVGLVQTSDSYVYKEKRRTLVEFEKKDHSYKKYIKNHSLIVIKINWIKSHPLRVALDKTDQKGVEFYCHKLWCFNMPISLQPDVVKALIFEPMNSIRSKCLIFQPMNSIRSKCLSLKV